MGPKITMNGTIKVTNPNDRKLLELAAIAAGEWPSPEPFEHVLDRWNPLENGDDALKLLGILRLNLKVGVVASSVQVNGVGTFIELDLDGDLPAAIRRAIVTAAAYMAEHKITLENVLAADKPKEERCWACNGTGVIHRLNPDDESIQLDPCMACQLGKGWTRYEKY